MSEGAVAGLGGLRWAGPGGCGACSRVALDIERFDLIAAEVQVLAAAQAPWAADRQVAVVADPPPGRVEPAVDAELDGVRQQARRGDHAPRGAGASGSRAVLAGRCVRGRRQILAEPCCADTEAWSAGQVEFLALGWRANG